MRFPAVGMTAAGLALANQFLGLGLHPEDGSKLRLAGPSGRRASFPPGRIHLLSVALSFVLVIHSAERRSGSHRRLRDPIATLIVSVLITSLRSVSCGRPS